MCFLHRESTAQPNDDAQRFAPGRLLIGFDRADAAAAQVAASVVSIATSDDQLYRFKTMPWMAIVDVPVGTERDFIGLLSLADGIDWVSVDGYGGLTQVGTSCEDPNIYPSNDPHLNDQWWVERIRLHDVWAAGDLGLPDVVLAVIDTGVNYRHPDLAYNMWINDDPPGDVPGVGNGADDDDNGIVDDTYGAAFVPLTGDSDPCFAGGSICVSYGQPLCLECEGGAREPYDNLSTYPLDCGAFPPPNDDGGSHGTAIASIIAAVGNNDIALRGFSCNVKVMPVRVSGRCVFRPHSESDFIQALEYACIEGARVVSNSTLTLEGGVATEDAIRNLTDEFDVLFVTSAGNAGVDVDNPASPGVYSPQRLNYPTVVTVGGTALDVDEFGSPLDVRWSNSNYGPGIVDIMAPAVSIRVFDDPDPLPPTPRYVSGTSFSTPMVAAAAAMYRAQNPTATAVMTRQALLSSCAPVVFFDEYCECEGVLDVAGLLGL